MDAPHENTYNWYEDQQRLAYYPQEPTALQYHGLSQSFDPPVPPFHSNLTNPSLPFAVAPQPYDIPGGFAPSYFYPDSRPGSSYNGGVSGGGDDQRFFARESVRLYGMPPTVHRDVSFFLIFIGIYFYFWRVAGIYENDLFENKKLLIFFFLVGDNLMMGLCGNDLFQNLNRFVDTKNYFLNVSKEDHPKSVINGYKYPLHLTHPKTAQE